MIEQTFRNKLSLAEIHPGCNGQFFIPTYGQLASYYIIIIIILI